jgi:hypothetical protein
MTKWISRRAYEGRHRAIEQDATAESGSQNDANGTESLVVLSALLGGRQSSA